jgi:signal transduction histidine kinase/GAF domain-containing protein/ActR/RegA family two-component response regulator
MKIDFDRISSIPVGFTENCQTMLNNLADFAQVPAALIMKVEESFIEVFASSESRENPYIVGEKEHLPAGLYCETVISKLEKLAVTNALKDQNWDQNPDIKLGMISYLGFPLLFPNGDIFGTICILDTKERFFDENCEKLLLMLKNLFEENLKSINSITQKNKVLEMIAKGQSLTETLDILIKDVESQISNVRCSILLLGKSGKTLHKGSSPSLPDSYCDALDGIKIGPSVGSCGTAAYTNETVISEDIQTDPKWKRGRGLALSHNLRACWSAPIRDTEGKVLGTLCPYFDEPRKPTNVELEIVLYSAYLSGIAIQLKQGQEALQKSERLARDSFEKMRSVLDGTSSESGDAFFRSLVFHLASALKVRYAFFTECVGPHKNKMMALWMGKHFGDNIEYDTRGTPCEPNENGDVVCYYPEKVQENFKDDHMLVDWEVESYLGVRLLDSSGKQVGSIAVMDDKPLVNGNIAKIILSTLALRGQAELNRQKTDKELSLAKDAAEKGSRAKSEFLSRMSHELRTPMNAILGFTQLMEMDARNPLIDYQKDYVEQISIAGKHLLDLINEVLELSNIESGKMRVALSPVNLVETVDDVISLSKPLADQNSVTIECQETSDETYIVEADRLRLNQVALNLITNAIKYNKPNGSVVVSFEKRENNTIRLGIRDTGRGISKEERGKLFQPFERFNINSETIEGTGIGLAISKQLVEMMNGAIGFESAAEEGSFFYIDMAVSSNTPVPLNSKTESNSNLSFEDETKIRKILYIDDLTNNIELMEQALSLKRPNIILLSASNALGGIELAKMQSPDLILMDIQMPDMDGLTAFKRLQSINETKNIPVIALTASAMDSDIKEALDMGFEFYITKPIDIHKVFDTLDKVLCD